MARRKLPLSLIPLRAHPPHPQLFPPPHTPAQQQVLNHADGIHDIRALARDSGISPDQIIEVVDALLKRGELREATPAEMRARAGEELARGRHANAIRLFKRLLQQDRDDHETRRRLASLLERNARPREAAIQYLQLAAHMTRSGDTEAARALYRKAALLQPNDPSIQDKVAGFCLAEERIDEAATVWIQGIRHLLDAGEVDRARTRLMETLERLPGHPLLLSLQSACFPPAPPLPPGTPSATATAARSVLNRQRTRRRIRMAVLGILLASSLAAWHRLHEGRALQRTNGQIDVLLHDLSAAPPDERLSRVARAQSRAKSVQVLWPDHRRAHDRLRRNLEAMDQDLRAHLDARHARQADLLSTWNTLPPDAPAERVVSLLADLRAVQADATSPHAQAAADALAVHAGRVTRIRETQDRLLRILKDPDESAADRFDACHRLLRAPPFLNVDGSVAPPPDLSGIRLPVRIEVHDGDGTRIPFHVRDRNRRIEPDNAGHHPLPLDPETEVWIVHPGWQTVRVEPPVSTELLATARTHLPFREGVQPVYRIEVRREFRWRRELPTASVMPPVIDERGMRVFVADAEGTVRALERESGRVLWEDAHSVPVPLPLLVGQGRVAALDRDGGIRMLQASTGARLWSGQAMRRPRGWSAARFALALPDEPGARTPELAVSGAEPPHLTALRGDDGTPVWGNGEGTGAAFRRAIDMPAGAPFHAGWHLLQLDRHGTLHVLFDHGAPVARLALPGITDVEGDPLYVRTGRHVVLLLVRQSGEGIGAFRVELDAARPEVETEWTYRDPELAGDVLAAPLLADGAWLYAGFASGRIRQLRLRDGTPPTPDTPEIRLGGAPTGPMDAADGLVVAAHFVEGEMERAGVTAWLADPDRGLRFAWKYTFPEGEIPSGVRVFRDGRGRVLTLLQAGKNVYCFEEDVQPTPLHDR